MTCVCVPGMYPDIPFSRSLSQRRWVAQPCPCPTTLFFSLLLRQSWMTCAQKPFYRRWLSRFLRRLKLYVRLQTRCSSAQQIGTTGNMPSTESQPFTRYSCWDVLCSTSSPPSQVKGSTGKIQACTESSSFSIGPCHLFKLGRPYARCCSKNSMKFPTEKLSGATAMILLASRCRDLGMLRCFPGLLPLQKVRHSTGVADRP